MNLDELKTLQEEFLYALQYYPEAEKAKEIGDKLAYVIGYIVSSKKEQKSPELQFAMLQGKVEAYENALSSLRRN